MRTARSTSGNAEQDVRAAFEQERCAPTPVDVPEVLAQRPARDLGERAGEFDAGRTTADDHECQQTPLCIRIGLALRRFEREQHPPSDLERIVQRLQSGRTRRPFGMAEVRVRGAGRDDQVVVRSQRLWCAAASRTRIEGHSSLGRIDRASLGQQHRAFC